ncbi:MAG: glycosyltransferase family 4 protein [Myxococcota bacterium]
MSAHAPPAGPACDWADPRADHRPPHRLAIVALHPVQYQVGMWRVMAEHPRLDVRVFYLDRMGTDGTVDRTLDVELKWDLPMLEGYPYEFVSNWSPMRFTPFVSRINPRLFPRLLQEPFDAVMVHGYQALSNWVALASAKLRNIPVIYRGEGSVLGNEPPMGGLARARRLSHELNRHFLRACRHVAYSSADNRAFQLLRGARREALFSMPCAVDNEMIDRLAEEVADQPRLRVRFDLHAEAVIILTAGRFSPGKRFEDAIMAVARVAAEGYDVHLFIAGNGPVGSELPLKRTIEAHDVRDRVHFLGWLSPAELVSAMSGADLFVMSSRVDRSPKAMSEALVMGLPVISSDRVGTARELVREGENGYVYACGDVDALAASITRLAADGDARRAMGAASRRLAARHDFNAATEALVSVLDELPPEERPWRPKR